MPTSANNGLGLPSLSTIRPYYLITRCRPTFGQPTAPPNPASTVHFSTPPPPPPSSALASRRRLSLPQPRKQTPALASPRSFHHSCPFTPITILHSNRNKGLRCGAAHPSIWLPHRTSNQTGRRRRCTRSARPATAITSTCELGAHPSACRRHEATTATSSPWAAPPSSTCWQPRAVRGRQSAHACRPRAKWCTQSAGRGCCWAWRC